MSRKNRATREVAAQEPVVASALQQVQLEDEVQEHTVPPGWQEIEGGEEVVVVVDLDDQGGVDQEFLREVQVSLDTDGIDPEDDGTLDHDADISQDTLALLDQLERSDDQPTPEVQQPAPVEPLDARAPMSPEAVAAVAALLNKPSPRPDVRPRMDAARLEMRVRIAPEWIGKNPKSPTSIAHQNFALYVDGMTVSAYLATHDRRRARADLQWDLDHGFVRLQSTAEWAASVTPSSSEEYES